MKRQLGAGLLLVVLTLAGCATRIPVVTTPTYPEYQLPTVPALYAGSAVAQRHRDAWTFFQAGDLAAAETRYLRLLQSTPDFYPATTALGWLDLARGDADGAVMYFDQAVATEPTYVPALIGRGEALMVAENDAGALQAFEAVLAVDPSQATIARIVQELRFTIMSEQLEVARQAASAERYAEARAAYEQVITASPDSGFLYVELGRVELQQGDRAAALRYARQAAQLDPGDPAPLVLEGETHEAAGDWSAAVVAYERAERLDPTAEVSRRLDRLNERIRLAGLPDEITSIPDKPSITRGDLAGLIGGRFPTLLRDGAGSRVPIITDTRDHWAHNWILAVTQAQVMTVDAAYRFQPNRAVRRSELAEVADAMLDLMGERMPDASGRWDDAQPQFADMRPGHLSYPAVARAVAAGVLTVSDGEAFEPTRLVTGAEAVEATDRLAALIYELQ